MNIELQVKNLFKNAHLLDEAGFVADFYYIAKEYARQQLLQQKPCTTPVTNRCLCGAEIPEDDPYDGYCTDCG